MNIDPKTAAIIVVDRIMTDMLDRRGFRQAFEECDESIQNEITESWVNVAEDAIKQNIVE